MLHEFKLAVVGAFVAASLINGPQAEVATQAAEQTSVIETQADAERDELTSFALAKVARREQGPGSRFELKGRAIN